MPRLLACRPVVVIRIDQKELDTSFGVQLGITHRTDIILGVLLYEIS